MTLDALVTTEWLAAHLADPDLRVLDGSWHMPSLGRNARAEFAAAHVPGAAFFDIDEIADHGTPLPHMLPTPAEFADAVGALGVGDGDRVVVYDTRGVASAARVWWTLRVFGHDAVALLDGGFPRWREEKRPVESGPSSPVRRRFTPKFRKELVRGLSDMLTNLTNGREQVLDARSHGRFTGTEPEPREGLKGGHIPGSLNLPYDQLYGAGGTLLAREELRHRFEAAGLDLSKPIVTTCGSGVTASVLAFGLHVIGRPDVPVYDGSWTEWGGRDDTPIDR
jgi:thiosulfate/3-mercaptopyruvate sulfurtransferase